MAQDKVTAGSLLTAHQEEPDRTVNSLVSLKEDESVSFTVLIAANLDSKGDKSLYLPSAL